MSTPTRLSSTAQALVLKLIEGAKQSLLPIDNWATPEVLDLFATFLAGRRIFGLSFRAFSS